MAVADAWRLLMEARPGVRVQVDETAEVTTGGLVLPESAREKPVSGEVVRVGPGKTEEDGSVTKPVVAAGEKVVYFKYAGDNMETTAGVKYVVLHEQDILCKA